MKTKKPSKKCVVVRRCGCFVHGRKRTKTSRS